MKRITTVAGIVAMLGMTTASPAFGAASQNASCQGMLRSSLESPKDPGNGSAHSFAPGQKTDCAGGGES